MKLVRMTMLGMMLLGIGCASTHPGNLGKSVSGDSLPLKVSAKTIGSSDGEAFQLLDVTFENQSDQWVRIKSARVRLSNSPDSKVSMVVGDDLQTWAIAKDAELKRAAHNRAMLQTGILVAGTIASVGGAASDNEGLAAAGAVAVAGTYAWAVTDVISAMKHAAETSGNLPKDHISNSFSVPGKLYTRKWVLLNKPSNETISRLVLEVETIEGESSIYEIAMSR